MTVRCLHSLSSLFLSLSSPLRSVRPAADDSDGGQGPAAEEGGVPCANLGEWALSSDPSLPPFALLSWGVGLDPVSPTPAAALC